MPAEFIAQYFINPIYTGEGYNIFNTLVYAIGLILALYAIQWGLKKKGIKVDKKFFWAALPYIVLGGMLRALSDYAASAYGFQHWLLITPGIYFLIAGIFAVSLLVAGMTKDRMAATKRLGWVYTTLAFAGVLFAATTVFDAVALGGIVGFTVGLSAVMWYALGKMGIRTQENIAVCAGQMLDASASAIAVTFLGYFEQHIVSGAIMDLGSPFLFVPVKMLVTLGALYVIEKHSDDPTWEWLLKIVVITLGLATGTRDAVRVFLKV